MSSNVNIPMQDKEILHDSLSSQKEITSVYNVFSNECASTALRNEMLNILHDEHSIQADIFNEMQKRGWYPTEPAEEQKIKRETEIYESKRPERITGSM